MPKWVTSGYKAGDLVIFDFPNTSSTTDHIGIVESVSGTTLTTIEGNTSFDDSGSQSNGGAVARKKRSTSVVLGAYRPDYTSTMTADKILKIAAAEIGTTESPANSNKQKYGEAYGWNGVAWCVIFVWWCFKQAGMSSLFYGGSKVAGCANVVSYAKKGGTSTSSSTTTTKAASTCTTKAQLIESGRSYDSGYCKSLQALLNCKMNAGLTVDGQLGTKTISAIKSFQTKAGLTSDGSCGTNTWNALVKY